MDRSSAHVRRTLQTMCGDMHRARPPSCTSAAPHDAACTLELQGQSSVDEAGYRALVSKRSQRNSRSSSRQSNSKALHVNEATDEAGDAAHVDWVYSSPMDPTLFYLLSLGDTAAPTRNSRSSPTSTRHISITVGHQTYDLNVTLVVPECSALDVRSAVDSILRRSEA